MTRISCRSGLAAVGAALAAVLVLPLGGCASFNGEPKPVLQSSQLVAVLDAYQPAAAVETYYGLPGSDSRTAYRNRVITAYLAAMDARYDEFRRSLSRGRKGAHLGADAATLGLTGAGAIWTGPASGLAAGATALSGLRASFDRELFAEKTLPALITLMDSSRLRVRADILRGMGKPAEEYSIEEAFADLSRYQSAASIDAAIGQATASAARDSEAAAYDYSRAVSLCRVDKALSDDRKKLMQSIEQLEVDAETAEGAGQAAVAAAKRQDLLAVATAAGIASPGLAADAAAASAQLDAIGALLDNVCSAGDLTLMKTRIQQSGVTLP